MLHDAITFAAIIGGMLASHWLGALSGKHEAGGKTAVKIDQTIYDTRPDRIPLKEAGLCLDCDIISATHTNCPNCGSKSILNISRILNRKEICNDFCKLQTEPKATQGAGEAKEAGPAAVDQRRSRDS